MSKPVCLVICSGKNCRGEKGFDKLMNLAQCSKGSLQAPCQGLCHGPIIAVKDGSSVHWFSHIRSRSSRKLVTKSLMKGRIDKDLARLEVTKRRDIVRSAGRLRPVTS